ncbi:MAG: DUF5618 family protein [Dysgonamonadaceae bacterium]|jgi:hypothetical protein|nr:DUF5618 family protein [Dysgonamonadaceae bacterium]
MTEIQHPIREAERYLQNAREILSKQAGKDGNYYSDKKYVRMAGHAAWCGVLVALDAALGVKKCLKRRQRPEFKDYQEAVSKIDGKMNRPLLNSYETLHKVLGYDGNLNYGIVQSGLKEAQYIIDWAEKNYQNN